MAKKFKRYCKTLKLRDDPDLIEEYKKAHAIGAVWPEITQGMRDIGIIDMEIYIAGNQLFMIMDTRAEFDHNAAMATLATLPRQAEWEAYVSRFQLTSDTAAAADKWRLMQRIYELEQKKDSTPEQGYEKEC